MRVNLQGMPTCKQNPTHKCLIPGMFLPGRREVHLGYRQAASERKAGDASRHR